MSKAGNAIWCVVALIAFAGCQAPAKMPSHPQPFDAKQVCEKRSPVVEEKPVEKPRVKRHWTDKQIDALRTFALQESPSLWQTVQALKAEGESRRAGLASLKKDLEEFGRNPEEDKDYLALKESCKGIEDSLDAVYGKIEPAYIAYRKYQATPGKKEYDNIMRHALEDGIQEADAAFRRYKKMTLLK